jgi:hypothetical protein
MIGQMIRSSTQMMVLVLGPKPRFQMRANNKALVRARHEAAKRRQLDIT